MENDHGPEGKYKEVNENERSKNVKEAYEKIKALKNEDWALNVNQFGEYKTDQMAPFHAPSTRQIPNVIKRLFLNVWKKQESYLNPFNFNQFIYCMECHKLFSNIYFIYVNNESPIIHETGPLDLEYLKDQMKENKLRYDLSILQAPKEEVYPGYYPGWGSDRGYVPPEKRVNGVPRRRYCNLLVMYDIQVKKALNQKSRIEPKDSFIYCPYCGAPTTEFFTGIELLNKSFGIYHKNYQNRWKYGKPKKKQLMDVPKSRHEPPKWLKELNDNELIEVYSFAHLLRMNLLKKLFLSLGEFKKEYMVRSDRGNPKIVIRDFMRGEEYYIHKGIFNVGEYKKNVLIFSKHKDNLEINCICDINLIEHKTLKKNLALKKLLEKGGVDGFKPESKALVFEYGPYIIYIPVESSFLEFLDINDINNFKEVSNELAFKGDPNNSDVVNRLLKMMNLENVVGEFEVSIQSGEKILLRSYKSLFKIWSDYKVLEDGKVAVTVSLRSRGKLGWWDFDDIIEGIEKIYENPKKRQNRRARYKIKDE